MVSEEDVVEILKKLRVKKNFDIIQDEKIFKMLWEFLLDNYDVDCDDGKILFFVEEDNFSIGFVVDYSDIDLKNLDSFRPNCLTVYNGFVMDDDGWIICVCKSDEFDEDVCW